MARSAGRRIGNHRAVAWRWAAAMALLLGLLGCWLPAAREARATDLTLALNIEGQGLALTQAGIGLAGWDGTARTLTVTTGGPIAAALLYWAGRERPCEYLNGITCVIPRQPYTDQQLVFGGALVTGTITGINTQPAAVGGPILNIGYVADVTAIVRAAGVGTRDFTLEDSDAASDLWRLEGASLLVVYTDPADPATHRVILWNGLDFAHGDDPTPGAPRATAPVAFDHGALPAARRGQLTIVAGGGTPGRPDRLDIANNPSLSGTLDGSAGAAWDSDTHPIDIPANAGTTTVQLASAPAGQDPDQLLWQVAALRLPVVAASAAADDTYATTVNTPLVVSAPGVLANDTSTAPPPTAVEAVLPAHGILTALNADGSFTYTPNPGFVGTDAFAYRLNGNTIATVAITVVGPAVRFYVAEPAGATADTPFTVAVTAQDVAGHTATGYVGTVRFTSDDPQATLPADAALPGGVGTFGATLRTAGSRTLVATDTVNASITDSATIAVAPGPPAAIAPTAGTPQSAQIGTAFATSLRARVTDASGNALSGVTVTFSVPAPGAAPGGTFAGAATSATATTGANGEAVAPILTANGVVGPFGATASAPGVATPAQFALANRAGPPASITPAAGFGQSATVNTAFAAALAATVRDAGGNPVAGVPVTFAAPADGAGGTFVGAVTSAVATTGADGVAVAPIFTANGTAGSYIATATAPGVATPAQFAMTNTAILPVVTASVVGGGAVSPVGAVSYPIGTVATYAAAPDAGHLFLGWTLDGEYVGFASPLMFTVSADRALVATFAPRHAFADVVPTGVAWDAITQLAARGVINGYGADECAARRLAAPCYGPADTVLRAQIAALIVRGLGWDAERPSGPAPFADLGAVDAELQRAITILAQRGIARGYGDGTYGPLDAVTRAQAVSLIARSMVQAGYWTAVTPAEDDGTAYPNVPRTSDHRLDLLTFVKYAGALPDRPTGQTWADWETDAPRAWTAQVLWQALASQFGVDRVP